MEKGESAGAAIHLGFGFVGVFLADDHPCCVVDEHPGVGREGFELFRCRRVGREDGAEGGAVDGVDVLQAYLFGGECDATACLITPAAGDNSGEEDEQTRASEKMCS